MGLDQRKSSGNLLNRNTELTRNSVVSKVVASLGSRIRQHALENRLTMVRKVVLVCGSIDDTVTVGSVALHGWPPEPVMN